MTAPTGADELSDFDALSQRYRRELIAHCYRMCGSATDAEDLVQETLLRAWKSAEKFEGRASVRTWLHRIATNVCLTDLEKKPKRPLPTGLGTSDSVAGDDLGRNDEIPWLEPLPDAAVQVEERDTIRLAFVAALQHLPPKQRAVLILRDVLRWTAKETAETLDTTPAAVNSALQRAHAAMAASALTPDSVAVDLTTDQKQMLDAYLEAFWAKDVGRIVKLLAADAVWEMPPFSSWFQGAENIGQLIDTQCPGGVHDMPMLATTANGQPAFGLYMRTTAGDFEPFQLQVLELQGTVVRRVAAFFNADFTSFGLPARLPAGHLPAVG